MSSKEVRKAYYERNKEIILEKARGTYQLNRDVLLLYQKNYRIENKKVIHQKAQHKKQLRQQQAVERLGNCCSCCGKQYPNCVYDFHHVNPKEKLFSIGENPLIGKKKYFAEVDKCILLCANCHRMHHRKDSNAS